ncbi:MAG TPA: YncE family protein, partial [Burkholderiales bacterium]|nr:YncE family protein [Burkholderiales bacterium]
PDGAHVYVSNIADNTVSVINTATNTVGTTITGLGTEPAHVAIMPNGTRAFVTNQVSNDVSVIDTATNKVAATVPVGKFPFGLAITPDGTRAYVACLDSLNVSVINTATNTEAAKVSVGGQPSGVAITPALAPFAVFEVKVEFELHHQYADHDEFDSHHRRYDHDEFEWHRHSANRDEFHMKAKFTLAAGSNGIAPLTEDVTLKIGTFSATIPAGSFRQYRKGEFKYEGTIGGGKLEAEITRRGAGNYEFRAEGSHLNLAGVAKHRTTVGLTIGEVGGSTTVTPKFER